MTTEPNGHDDAGPYCVLCETPGHTIRTCPTRDDDLDEDNADDLDAELEWTLHGDPALDDVTYPAEETLAELEHETGDR